MRDGTGVDPREARVAHCQFLQAHVFHTTQVQGIVLVRHEGAAHAVGQLAFPSWWHEVQQACLPVDVVLPLAVQLRQQIERVPPCTGQRHQGWRGQIVDSRPV